MKKIEKIRQEIERLKEFNRSMADHAINSNMRNFYDGEKDCCKQILSFLDTFSEKEPEADLEKEIEWEWVHREKQEVDLIECAEMDREEFARFARHFAELGADHAPLPEDTVIFNKGIEEGKRLMAEDAEEYEVMDFSSSLERHPHISIHLDNKKYRFGDKVRIIIVKED